MRVSGYFRPDTLNQALAHLAGGPATVAAGCTDLFPATEAQTLRGPVLDLTGIAELRGVREGPEGWRIGATTTWSDILNADLPPGFDMLRQAAREVGSVQIQNSATVAGNLCNASPAADGVPPLLALDAEVEIAWATGRRRLPLGDFITGVRRTALRPGEMVAAIHVPRAAGQGCSRFLKLGARRYMVISIASVAVRVVVKDGRADRLAIAVGSCSPVAVRLYALEDRLRGLPLSDLTGAVDAGLVGAALSPIADLRGDAGYRGQAAVELLRRALAGLDAEVAV